MNLIIALCLLSGCVAPHACRSVDTREPAAQDLEPFVARHHHEGNIAELLIPLLERSLAQSEARSTERQHRRPKPGKKVIQVLPYPGSEEHKRKGWRKLKSHKKQVVEITPLHGKNGAKPLAYILSAAKSSHAEKTANDDSVSDGEHDKTTSEQQSEEKNANILKSTEVSSSNSNNPTSEYISDKDSETSNKESSSSLTAESNEKSGNQGKSIEDVSTEFRFAKQHGVKSYNHKVLVSDEEKSVTVEDSDFTGELRFGRQKGVKSHNHKVLVSDEDKSVTLENDYLTGEDEAVTSEDSTSESSSEDKIDSRNADLTGESQVTLEHEELTEESSVTEEERDVTSENKAVTSEIKDFTAEIKDLTEEIKDVTLENKDLTAEFDVTAEKIDVTSENRDVTSELDVTAEKAVTQEAAVTSEDKSVTFEESATVEQFSDVTLEDFTSEDRAVTSELDVTSENNGVTTEILDPGHTHTHDHHHHHHAHIDDVNVTAEDKLGIPDNPINSREFIADDIVISHHDSTEKNFGKMFDTNARDIIELIQSSVEASTAKHRDCKESHDKHSHDHKSYRLSFLFNK